MSFLLEPYRHTVAVIDLDNLAANFHHLKKINGEQNFFCPMVKANAYGHGDIDVALRLQAEGATHLGVGLIEEALLLRHNGVTTDLLVFGIFDSKGAEEIAKWNLTPVISLWSQIEALEKIRNLNLAQKIKIHLKFDTGMNRLGFEVTDVDRLFDHLHDHPSLELAGICTHLHSGENASDTSGSSFQQLQIFQRAVEIFSPLDLHVHTLNSAGLLNFQKLRAAGSTLPHGISLQQGARPGLLLYGCAPMNDPSLQEILRPLKPVMTLRSTIVRYHRLNPGDTVSYGATWTASSSAVIGVVPMGYADGYHRKLSNHAEALVRGQRVRQVGNVCMDYIMLNVTGVVSDAEIAQNIEIPVTLLGEESADLKITANELAAHAETIPWEILTSISERVPRLNSHKSGGSKS